MNAALVVCEGCGVWRRPWQTHHRYLDLDANGIVVERDCDTWPKPQAAPSLHEGPLSRCAPLSTYAQGVEDLLEDITREAYNQGIPPMGIWIHISPPAPTPCCQDTIGPVCTTPTERSGEEESPFPP